MIRFRGIILSALLLVVSLTACRTHYSNSYPIDLYRVKAKGSPPEMKVRLISDHSSITPNHVFKLGFFFRIEEGWYTYSKKENESNIPTEIILNLPPGYSIIMEDWPEPKQTKGKVEGEIEFIYNEDFKVIYTVKAPDTLSDRQRISASGRWQICQGSLCTLGGAQLELELNTGRIKKSKLFRLLN